MLKLPFILSWLKLEFYSWLTLVAKWSIYNEKGKKKKKSFLIWFGTLGCPQFVIFFFTGKLWYKKRVYIHEF